MSSIADSEQMDDFVVESQCPHFSRGSALFEKNAPEVAAVHSELAKRKVMQRLAFQEKESKTTLPILRQFFRAKKEYPDHVLLFRMGDFYEAFDEEARDVAELLSIQLSTKYGLDFCGFPAVSLNRYLKNLLDKDFRVAICEQIVKRDPMDNKKVIDDRQVVRVLSPGTVTDDEHLVEGQANFLLSLSSYGDSIAVAQMEMSTGELFVQRLASSESIPHHLSKFDASELILPPKLLSLPLFHVSDELDPDDIRMRDLNYAGVIRCRVLGNCCVTVRDPADFKTTLAASLFEEAAEPHKVKEVLKLPAAERSALAGLLSFGKFSLIGRTPKISGFKIGGANPFQSKTMHIDPSALKNLEILKPANGGRTGSLGSLMKVVKMTSTPAGFRLLSQRLKEPSLDKREIQSRLDSVEFIRRHAFLQRALAKAIASKTDPHRALQRIKDGIQKTQDLAILADGLDSTVACQRELEKEHRICTESDGDEDRKSSLCYEGSEIDLAASTIKHCSEMMGDLLDDFRRGVARDVDEANGSYIVRGNVKACYDAGLDAARMMVHQQDELLDAKVAEICRKHEISVNELKRDPVRIIKRPNGLIFVQVDKPFSNSFDAEPEEYRKIKELKNKCEYRCKALVDFENESINAEQKLQDAEKRVFQEFCTRIRERAEPIKAMLDSLAEIDVNLSFARLADELTLTRPEFVDEIVLEVEQGRHLVVESQGSRRGARPFQPNNAFLGGRHAPNWLLTGPNMGGKSTFLRQNAQLVILAQAGSFVPAEKATLGLVDKIFCRVGAYDELVSDRSTFMVEMEETATILHEATERSFVIIDEIGRGTSTIDGTAISQAVLEALCERGCRTLFATHFHDVPDRVADRVEDVRFVHLEAKVDSSGQILYTYNITDGVAGQSYGINAARLAFVPEDVLQRASSIISKVETSAEIGSFAATALKNVEIETLEKEEALNILLALKSKLS